MPNTSATGGYILPNGTPAAPLQDLALVLVFQRLVVGVTGLPGDMVRPRWQPNPPNMPNNGVSWVALGISAQTPQGFPYIEHDGTGDGRDLFQRQETVTVLGSFYGPDAGKNAGLVSDGLMVEQNRYELVENRIGLVYVDEARAVPSLINNQWYNRLDMPITVNREILRAYPVLNLLSATIGVVTTGPSGSVEELSYTVNVQP